MHNAERIPNSYFLILHYLFRVQLHYQLLLHRQIDLLARRHRHDASGDRCRVEGEPAGDAAALHLFHRMFDRRVLLRPAEYRDHVAFLHRVRRDVHLLAVDEEVPVAHELPGLRTRRRQAEPVDDVVEPPLEKLQQRHARDAARPLGRLEVAAELILEHAVDALHLLLLAELQAVAGELRLPRLAVLARREVALLDGALLRVAAFPFQEQLHALAAAQPADGSNVTRHLHSPPLRWTAAVVRNRRDVADRFHFEADRLQCADRRL